MRMHDRMDIRPRFVDGGMDEALKIQRALLVAHRLAIEPEFDDIVTLDQLGRHRARQKEMLRVVRIADADMTVGIDHLLAREDSVGDDEVLDDGIEIAHGSMARA
jgi:ABC-type phosphonate transport system ATPase subunit